MAGCKGMTCQKWSSQEVELLKKLVVDMPVKDATKVLNEHFRTSRSHKSVKAAMIRFGIKTGRSGCFPKGHIPSNKGKTWDEFGLSPEAQASIRRTHFTKGRRADNEKEIGAERITLDGYTVVRVEGYLNPSGVKEYWKLKHRVVWEQHHGQPVPESCMIVFADRNKSNFDPENLVCIKRKYWATISVLGIEYFDRESLEVAITLAKIKQQARKFSKRSN